MARAAGTQLNLDVYGLTIGVDGDWPEVLENIRLDFAWFERESAARTDVGVTVECRAPDFEAFGNLAATFVTPRNVVYQDGRRTVIDYFGRAIAIFERASRRLLVHGEDAHLVHEAAYQFLVSATGQHLDARGLVRMHALGLVGAEGAVAVMLPSGGGKSTLALRALQSDEAKLLSEDTPLIDRQGRVHPFPLRIGVNATDAARLPEGTFRRIERMEFHPKLALDIDAFADRIHAAPAPLRHVVLGRRTLGRDAVLTRVPRRAALGPLFREVVFGVGVYQGMEFVLERGMRDVARKARPALTRLACCAAALAHAEVWRCEFGRDHEQNWEVLRPLFLGERTAE
jgi:hypothetical protein